MTAIVILVFKDSILGLVSSIQINANNMIEIGDWIQIPKYGADGAVLEITLNTVKVQNWDKTITSIPAYALISDSFKNWRGMQQSGGRRIKRSVFIDLNSIKFCDEKMLRRFRKIQYLKEYLEYKEKDIKKHNKEHKIDTSEIINGRHLTNIGTFRAYVVEYLKHHPKISQGMTMIVRHLQPTEHGLPVEIYTFTNDTDWVNYEGIQADIFDHILSVLHEFDLQAYQSPGGQDITRALACRGDGWARVYAAG
jgi:miniconductance mechanosensitive channel